MAALVQALQSCQGFGAGAGLPARRKDDMGSDAEAEEGLRSGSSDEGGQEGDEGQGWGRRKGPTGPQGRRGGGRGRRQQGGGKRGRVDGSGSGAFDSAEDAGEEASVADGRGKRQRAHRGALQLLLPCMRNRHSALIAQKRGVGRPRGRPPGRGRGRGRR